MLLGMAAIAVRAAPVEAAPAEPGALPFVPALQQGDVVPDTPFVDQFGRRRSLRELRGHPVVLSFFYSRCRDATQCSLVSGKFEELQRTLPRDARLVEFTIDPTHDTPPVLRAYGAMFGADPDVWLLATGDPEVMRQTAAGFGIGISSQTASSIAHSEVLGILNTSGYVARLVPGNAWQPQEVVAEVNAIEGVASNPWERLLLVVRYAASQCGLGNVSGGHLVELVLFVAGAATVALFLFGGDIVIRLRRKRARPDSGPSR